MKQPRLSLPQKLLALVAIPVFLDLCIVCLLTFLFFQLEAETRRSERAWKVIAKTGNITVHAKDACMNLVAYHLSGSRVFTSDHERMVKQIALDFSSLRELVGDDREQLNNINQLQTTTDKALKLIAKIQQKDEMTGDAPLLFQGFLMKGEVESIINDLITISAKIGERENQISPGASNRVADIRTAVGWVSIVGVIAISLTAILATAYLNQNISRRLSVLIENTIRLASGKELVPPVGGNDEIAQLDVTFREMAQARYEADKVKRDFLEMVSHDVRTPLMAVSATIEMISLGMLRPEKLDNDIKLADRNITQVLDLLSELLDLHRLEAGKLELDLQETDALSILTQAIETVRPTAVRRSVTINGCDTTTNITCDPDRVRQILVNLIANSVKFSPKGGTVTTNIVLSDANIKFTIRDQGPGIPAEFREKIFERFGQVQSSDAKVHGGKGLGLAICKALVDAHSGKIGVDSQEGEGSEFWVVLPQNPV